MNIQYLERNNKAKIAYIYSEPSDKGSVYPLVMFVGGYRSDMNGTKATYFEEQCRSRGQAYVRLDYSGHGMSDGEFDDGTIGSWTEDALAVFDHVTVENKRDVVIVGSSMGGWIGLLMALKRSDQIKGMIGIAAAPDFTEDLYERFSEEQKSDLENKGFVEVPNDYSYEPYRFTKTFYEESKSHLLLGKQRNIDFQLRLIQGMQDKDVPWKTAVRIQEVFGGSQSDVIFVDDGDHRLSRPEDLELIDNEIRIISALL